MRIASAIVLAVVVALFVFWWGWVRAPAPAEVCTHVLEVTLHDAAGLDPGTRERLGQATYESCVQRTHDKLELRGRLVYRRFVDCLTSAQSTDAMSRC